IHRPLPKGGRAFTVPIARAVVEVLRRRAVENVELVGEGVPWVFPTKSRDGEKVIPIVEKRWSNAAGDTPHRLRDTFATACAALRAPSLDLKTLLNPRPPKGSVTAGYVKPDVEHLRGYVEAVASFLLGKMG